MIPASVRFRSAIESLLVLARGRLRGASVAAPDSVGRGRNGGCVVISEDAVVTRRVRMSEMITRVARRYVETIR